jgi:hypothetical protein
MTNPPCLAVALYRVGPSKAAQLSGPALPSAPMISAQTDCRWVPCLLPALQLQHQTRRGSSAARSPFCSPADVPFGFVDLVGNTALDQPRVRSSGCEGRVLRTLVAEAIVIEPVSCKQIPDFLLRIGKFAHDDIYRVGWVNLESIGCERTGICVRHRG